MLTFWNSVTALRQIEFVTLLVAMIVPILCGTVLLSVHYRVKTLVNKTTVIQGVSYEGNVQRLENTNRALTHELQVAQTELAGLRHVTAPRQITESQEDIILEKLRGVQGSPVIVSAYAFEAESAAYAAAITAVLRKAGWEATMNKSSMNDFKGVSLGAVNVMHRSLPGEHELAQAFAAARMELHQRQIAPDTIAGQLQDGCLLVVVGRK
jgi:hypothetical protein